MNGFERVHKCVGHWTDDGEWQVSPGEPIVRCKDCIHSYEHHDARGRWLLCNWYAHTKGGCDEDGIIAEYAAKLRLANDGEEQ